MFYIKKNKIKLVLEKHFSLFVCFFFFLRIVTRKIDEDFLLEGVCEGEKDHLIDWKDVSLSQKKGALELV